MTVDCSSEDFTDPVSALGSDCPAGDDAIVDGHEGRDRAHGVGLGKITVRCHVDLDELNFRAVLAGCGDKAPAVEAQAIAAVEVHGAERAVLGHGTGTAVDARAGGKRPTDAGDAIAGPAAIARISHHGGVAAAADAESFRERARSKRRSAVATA